MNSSLHKKITALLLCFSLLLVPRPARAQSGNIGISNGQAAGILVAMIAVGAAIGVGVYFIVRRPPSVTGCAAANSDNLTLLNEADNQTYTLAGEIANIKAGNRIHVSGKKKKDPSGKQTFLVAKLAKDYGPCKVSP
jgi:hypothetical protein